MYQSYFLPKDISTNNEEIQKQILEYGNKEWRSRKDVLDFLQNNRLQEWRIIGWVSRRTIKKWEDWDRDDMWLIAKGNEWKYVHSMGVSYEESYYNNY